MCVVSQWRRVRYGRAKGVGVAGSSGTHMRFAKVNFFNYEN